LSPNSFVSVTTHTTVVTTTAPTSTGALTPRQVGSPILTSGEALSISKSPYSVEISLKVISANATFKAGDMINIRFSGIGSVSTWKVHQYLKIGDKISVVIRFVENSYWEAYDSDWSIITP